MGDIWSFVFPTIVVVLMGYLIGSFPTGVIYSRVFKDKSGVRKDVRQRGSKSTGATNIGRSHGLLAFLLVMVLDGLKGLISVWLAVSFFSQEFLLWVAGFSAVAGHFKSFWLFVLDKWFWKVKGLTKGGKGMSTTAGVLVALIISHQLPVVVLVILFVLWLGILTILRYMSLASISAAALFPILMASFHQSPEKIVVSVVLSAALIAAHTPNIRRWRKRVEPRFTLRKLTQENLPTCGFVIHPLDMQFVRDYFYAKTQDKGRIIRKLGKMISESPEKVLEDILWLKRSRFYKSVVIQSKTGKKVRVNFYITPLIPEQLMESRRGLKRVIVACELAVQDGCKVVGLGAHTARAGNGGKEIADPFGNDLAVTTGNTLTISSGIKGVLKAIKLMGKIPEELILAVLGKYGSIGKGIISITNPMFQEVIPIGRDDDIRKIERADVIISATSSETPLIKPEFLKTGAIVLDIARPRDVAAEVRESRKDVLVIDGGMIRIPGNVIFPPLTGLEPSLIWGCLGETILLTLEERWENYSLGKELDPKKVLEMEKLAEKHGFKVDALRSYEKPIATKEIEEIKLNIELARIATTPLPKSLS